MDNGQFIKGKDRAIVDYQRQQKTLSSSVGARGFSYEPGFMYDIQNALEIDTKFKISDLNYEILKEAVGRELKQLGLEYNLAYQAAEVQWELDKSTLLSDWQKELADVKQVQAHEEEILRLLAIEISLRGNTLLAAKTAIELQIEDYRQQITELDGTTGDYEIALAQGKLLTAQKKLEIIPFIEELIAVEEQIIVEELSLVDKQWIITGKIQDIIPKEYEILNKIGQIAARQNEIVTAELGLIDSQMQLVNAETGRISGKESLIEAESDLVQYKESTLRPVLEILIDAMDRYVDELAAQLDLYNQIADVKVEIAGIKEQKAEKEQEIYEKKSELIEVMAELVSLSEALAEYKEGVLSEAIGDLLNIYQEYTGALVEQLAIKEAITNIKIFIAGISEEQTAKELINYEKELTVDQQRQLFDAAVLAINLQRDSNAVTKYTLENTNLLSYIQEYISTHDNTFQSREASFNDVSNQRSLNKANEISIRQTTAEAMEDGRQGDIDSRERSSVDRIGYEADIRTASEGITARLNHILTQD